MSINRLLKTSFIEPNDINCSSEFAEFKNRNRWNERVFLIKHQSFVIVLIWMFVCNEDISHALAMTIIINFMLKLFVAVHSVIIIQWIRINLPNNLLLPLLLSSSFSKKHQVKLYRINIIYINICVMWIIV